MNVIVAVDENWGIGRDGDQLVYLSQDLKRFRALTTGHPVILGRKTDVYKRQLYAVPSREKAEFHGQ